MVGPSERATRIGEEIVRQLPGLRAVGAPKGTLFGGDPADPSLYPDLLATRGYEIPLPPPPGRKVRDSPFVRLRGTAYGRPVRLDLVVFDSSFAIAPPTLTLETAARFLGPDVPRATVFPWVLWACDPGSPKGITMTNRGRANITGLTARAAIGHTGAFAGRPIEGASRPPVRARLFAAAWDPRVAALLEDPTLLAEMATWERRAGTGFGNSGPTLPVIDAHHDRFRFATGLDAAIPPMEHATTVRDVLEFLVRAERTVTGLDPEVTPLPTVTFQDPPDSVPDVRPGYLCPSCGRLEILKYSETRNPTVGHYRTMNCGVDWFPPSTVTMGQSMAAYRASEAGGAGPVESVRRPSSK